jgi:hypothetical protein
MLLMYSGPLSQRIVWRSSAPFDRSIQRGGDTKGLQREILLMPKTSRLKSLITLVFFAQADFVLDALQQALYDHRSARDGGLVHHGNRGAQYVSIPYSERLAEAGV